ncbi:MAG: NAD-dependent epimerase/dehydratase family protein [Rickettsiaceae bacterium]|nr:NAD-dependent epimerase/dehydratase family protein [Rickettsiaceae bacterium]
MNNLLIFGYGYTAAYIASSLNSNQWNIIGTTRSQKAHHNIIEYNKNQISKALETVTHIIISIPPSIKGDIVLGEFKELLLATKNLKWIGYLSSSSVYGNHKGAWVDENTKLIPLSERAKNRVLAEQQWLDFGKQHNINTNVFRLAGIYGPSRNALESVTAGKAKSILKEGQCFSRIHVEDIANVVKLAISNNATSEIYNVADDYPCPTYEVNDFAAKLLNVSTPSMIKFSQASLSPMAKEFYADNKKISNRKIKAQLTVKLKYPTFREGLQSLIVR